MPLYYDPTADIRTCMFASIRTGLCPVTSGKEYCMYVCVLHTLHVQVFGFQVRIPRCVQ